MPKDQTIHDKAKAGDAQDVAQLLTEGVDPDERGIHNYTALHYAAVKGHTAVAQVLIQAGASLEAKQNDGWVPLHEASRSWANGSLDTLKLLLAHGAHPCPKEHKGQTPLDFVSGDTDPMQQAKAAALRAALAKANLSPWRP